jgi:hypothetical protein
MTNPAPVDDTPFEQAAIVDGSGTILRVISTPDISVVTMNTPPGCLAITPPPPNQNYRWNGTNWVATG